MISTFTAFFDANVFVSSKRASLVVTLAQSRMFRARWSARVHDEWTAAVARMGRKSISDLQGMRDAMDDAVDDCLIDNFEALEQMLAAISDPKLKLPDPKDAHILAAAIRCAADQIVTFNLRHFPPAVVAALDIEAIHPDEFLLNQLDLEEDDFIVAVVLDVVHYIRPPLTVADYCAALDRANVPKTAAELLRREQQIKAKIAEYARTG